MKTKVIIFAATILFSSFLVNAKPVTSGVQKLYIPNSDSYLKFLVDVNKKGNTAYVTTNDDAYVENDPMEFTIDRTIPWPPQVGQEIPAKWHVGSNLGDCYFDVRAEVVYLDIDATKEDLQLYRIMVKWTIPARVNPRCGSSGKRSFTRYYRRKY